MEANLGIKKWGNSLGVRIPAAVARAANLHLDQQVHMSVDNGILTITPCADADLTLAQRLEKFSPSRHGGENMQTDTYIGAEDLGLEQW
ncbi:MAG: AbrB/MazE/SpoVT family DNA-binding domain-containing protein [Gammaproteobacteria bacterium]|nr:AbrB/MazE/SpoVT family DNA-binding domain-containing protein [Gammaproteobacteria bacterium]